MMGLSKLHDYTGPYETTRIQWKVRPVLFWNHEVLSPQNYQSVRTCQLGRASKRKLILEPPRGFSGASSYPP